MATLIFSSKEEQNNIPQLILDFTDWYE